MHGFSLSKTGWIIKAKPGNGVDNMSPHDVKLSYHEK
jgi:hypothetical protein